MQSVLEQYGQTSSRELLMIFAGGDMARFRAPIEMHGDEEYLLHDNNVTAAPGVALSFTCDVLHVRPSYISII